MSHDSKVLPIAEIAASLLAAQPFPKLTKSATVKTPKFSYSYATLEAVTDVVRPALAEHNIVITYATSALLEGAQISCILIHTPTGQILSSTLPLDMPSDPQKVGSLLSYYKRYLLGMVTGVIAEEDDDGVRARPSVDDRTASPPAATQLSDEQKADNRNVWDKAVEENGGPLRCQACHNEVVPRMSKGTPDHPPHLYAKCEKTGCAKVVKARGYCYPVYKWAEFNKAAPEEEPFGE